MLHLDGIAAPAACPQDCRASMTACAVEDDPLFFSMPPDRAGAAFAPQRHRRRRSCRPRAIACCRGWPMARSDIFTREPPGHSRFIFLQGHPEYDPRHLGARISARHGRASCAARSPSAPAVPENYFDRATEDRLAEIGARSRPARYQEIVVGRPAAPDPGAAIPCGCSATG